VRRAATMPRTNGASRPGRPPPDLTIVGMGLPFIELRRFDDAIVAVKKALRRHPSRSM
jgi:hypothetical protein